MLDESLWSNVSRVISGSLAKFFIESQCSDRFDSVEVLDCFLNSSWSFLGSESCLSWLLEKVSLKSAKPLLEVGDK